MPGACRCRAAAHPDPTHAGLPIGLQVVGRRWREDTVLRVARAVELTEPDPSGAQRRVSRLGGR